jgi:hypothetical protein
VLVLADAADRTLAGPIQRARVTPSAMPATVDELWRQAIWFMAVIAFRAARAVV